MKWFSVFSNRTFYYRSLAALLAGIVALIVPNDAFDALVQLIGAFILLAGIGTAYSAHKSGHNLMYSLVGTASIVSISIGLLLIVKPGFFVNMVITLFGILLIVVGLLQIINVANLRSQIVRPRFYVVGGIIPIAIGGIFLVFPELIKSMSSVILGITLIIYALNELGLGFKMRKHFQPGGDVEDAEDAVIEEVDTEA